MKYKYILELMKKCKPLPKGIWDFSIVLLNLHEQYGFSFVD